MSEPVGLRGYIDEQVVWGDTTGFAAATDYLLEHVPQLLFPLSVWTYSRMRWDPQLTSILLAYGQAIERAHWSVDGNGCRDEITQAIADDLGLPVKGADDEPSGARRRRFTWAEHLRLAGLKRVFGFMPFEQAWASEGGRWRLSIVQERMPQTVEQVHLNDDGTLKSLEQAGLGKNTPKITTADHRLVLYVRNREGSNYFGQSLLRASYGPWLMKEQVLRAYATGVRKFAMGILEVQAPAGATPQQIAEAERYAQKGIQAGDKAGAGVPYGFTTNWRGLQGQMPDAMGLINYLDRAMTRSTLTSILDMAVAERGNRSLGETVMDLMILAQQADANAIAEDATRQIVVPLVDANWGEDEPAPRIVCGDVGADVELTAQDLNWLLEYGGLTPDEPLENWLRTRYGLPKFDAATARPTNPPTDPTTGAQQ